MLVALLRNAINRPSGVIVGQSQLPTGIDPPAVPLASVVNPVCPSQTTTKVFVPRFTPWLATKATKRPSGVIWTVLLSPKLGIKAFVWITSVTPLEVE